MVLPLLNLFILEAGILIKVDDVHTECGGLTHVLPLAVHLNIYGCIIVEGTIVRSSYSFLDPFPHVYGD